MNDQGQAWIVTPLHYSKNGKRHKLIRKASRGRRWNSIKGRKVITNQNFSWMEDKYNLEGTHNKQATNDGTRLPKYTMFEYSPVDDMVKK